MHTNIPIAAIVGLGLLAAPLLSAAGPAIHTVGGEGPEFCDFSDLQVAIDAASDGDFIHVAYEQIYLDQPLEVYNTSLSLRGGFTYCQASSPTDRTWLYGPVENRVLKFIRSTDHEGSVTLQMQNFGVSYGEALSGDEPFGAGGGILVWGASSHMTLSLFNTWVSSNFASYGGGIALVGVGSQGTGTNLWLELDANSRINFNQAVFGGGGIYCQDDQGPSTNSIVLFRGTRIEGNWTFGDGGGGYFSNCRNVLFQAHTSSNGLVMSHNEALYGEGGAIFATNNARVNLLGAVLNSDPHPRRGVALRNNEAAEGGAIAATGGARVTVTEGLIYNNKAERGGAVISKNNAQVTIRRADNQRDCPLQTNLAELAASPPILCSQVSHNQSTLEGGAFYVPASGRLRVERTYVWGNQAGGVNSAVLHLQGNGEDLDHAWFESSLVAGNQAGFGLFNVRNARLVMVGTTVTANTLLDAVDSAAVFVRADTGQTARAEVRGSILWQPGRQMASIISGQGTSTIMSDCLIGSQSAQDNGFTSNLFYSFIDPQFENADEHDFRLSSNSPAIDYCDGLGGLGGLTDITGRPRGAYYGQPTPPAPGGFPKAFYDLGAWEMRIDHLFRDRFEM